MPDENDDSENVQEKKKASLITDDDGNVSTMRALSWLCVLAAIGGMCIIGFRDDAPTDSLEMLVLYFLIFGIGGKGAQKAIEVIKAKKP